MSFLKTKLLCFSENSELLGVDEGVWLEFYLNTDKVEGIKTNPDGNVVVFMTSGQTYIIGDVTAEKLAVQCGHLIKLEKPVDNTPH